VVHPPTRPLSFLVISALLFAPFLCAQDNLLNDPDLNEMLKEAQEMQQQASELQKQNPTSPDAKKKLAEMLSQAKEEEAQQEQQEKREKEKLQSALKKQLEAPGPVVLPDWTPATPEFKAAGAPARKIVDDEVKIVQSGTSSLTPEKIADSWQAAAAAANNLNQSLNKINVNGKITRILCSQHAHRSQARSGTRSQPRAGQQDYTRRNLLAVTKAGYRERIRHGLARQELAISRRQD
jgi:hypothetical protein